MATWLLVAIGVTSVRGCDTVPWLSQPNKTCTTNPSPTNPSPTHTSPSNTSPTPVAQVLHPREVTRAQQFVAPVLALPHTGLEPEGDFWGAIPAGQALELELGCRRLKAGQGKGLCVSVEIRALYKAWHTWPGKAHSTLSRVQPAALFCSKVTPEMLLGVIHTEPTTRSSLFAFGVAFFFKNHGQNFGRT